MVLGAAGLLDALTGQRLFAGGILSRYIPMAVSTAVLFLIFGGVLALTASRVRGNRPALLVAIAIATLLGSQECLEYVLEAPDPFYERYYDELLALLSAGSTPMSPVTSAMFLLSGCAIWLFNSSPAGPQARLRNDIAGYLGVAIVFVSLTLLGGYLHGAPFFYDTHIVPVAITTAAAFLALGVGIVCAAGPGSLFLRAFFGDSVKARLMRTFPPMVAAMFLLHPLVELLVSQLFRGDVDLLFSLQVTVLAALTAGVTAFSVRLVGVSIDRETSMRQQAEAKAIREAARNQLQAEIAEALIRPGMTLKQLSDILHRIATKLTGSRHGFVSTIDPDTGHNIAHTLDAMFGRGECDMTRDIVFRRRPDGTYPALWGHPLNTRTGLFVNSPARHPASRGLPQGHVPLERFLSVPVLYERQLVGQIGLANPGRDYTQEDLDSVQALADLFAVGVHRIRAEQMLLAAKDGLEETVRQRTRDLEGANARLKHEMAEREMFQEALKESAALFRAVVEDQTEFICRFRPDGAILFVNNAYARYFGRSPEELVGQKFFTFLTPQAEEQVRELLAGITPDIPVRGHEHTVMLASGKVAWHSWTNRGIFDDAGGLLAFQAVGRDITQAKEAEQALRDLNERLEEKVRERTIQLEERTRSVLRMNADLQEQIATRQRAEEALSRTAQDLETKVRQITCLYALSESLVNSPPDQFREGFESSLGMLGRFLGYDQVLAFTREGEVGPLAQAHLWLAEEVDGPLPGFEELLAPLQQGLAAQEKISIPDVAALAASEPGWLPLSRAGVRRLMAVPLTIRGRRQGGLLLLSRAENPTAEDAGTGLLDNVSLLLANVLEKQRVDHSLRESERLARSIIESLAANICVIDSSGALTMVNQAWERFARENAPAGTPGLGIGANYIDVCRRAAEAGEALAGQAAEGLAAVLAGRQRLFDLEYSCHSPAEQRWFIMQAVAFTEGGGAVIAHRDITARVLAAEEVRKSEERYRIIVETAQEGVLGVDATSRISYANPRMLAMLGYKTGELTGRELAGIIAPEDHDLLRQKQKDRRQGVSDQYELRYLHKNGSRVWTVTSVAPVRNAQGEYTGTIGMALDISDRVRAELRIRRSEARYRSLVEAMQEGLLTIKANGRISFMNAPFARMLGRSHRDILGQPVESFVAGKSRAALRDMFAAQQQKPGAVEIVWEHSSGKHIYSLFSLSASRDDKGAVVGYSAIVTDTTERKALESQLLQSQKLEAIGQLAAGIAHEINTPAQYVGSNVRFIKSAFDDILAVCGRTRQFMQAARTAPPTCQDMDQLAALMAERDIDYLEAEVPAAIAQTLDGVERISTIVRSIKQFAHPGEMSMAPADLNEAMGSTVTVSRNEWKYVAEMETDLDASMPLVVCMIGEINQVVLNLIVNAAHAIAEVVRKEPGRKGRITLSTRYAPPWAEIRVADTGGGIPAEVQGKIFDPFFTTKEVGKGTGQGLTISRSIVVEKHGGQLFFETEPGVGTTFVVRLPLVQGKEHEA